MTTLWTIVHIKHHIVDKWQLSQDLNGEIYLLILAFTHCISLPACPKRPPLTLFQPFAEKTRASIMARTKQQWVRTYNCEPKDVPGGLAGTFESSYFTFSATLGMSHTHTWTCCSFEQKHWKISLLAGGLGRPFGAYWLQHFRQSASGLLWLHM